MMHAFKNLVVFTLDGDWQLTPGALEALLAQRPLTPCMPSQPSSTGWVSPADNGSLVVSYEGHLMVALGRETRLLPGGVINDALAIKVAEFESQRGFKPGSKAKRLMKEEVAAELMPRAFTKRSQTRAWIDPAARRIIVDASSAGKAEDVIEHLRDALETLPAVPWTTDASPSVVMTGWLERGDAPLPFGLSDGCLLTSAQDGRTKVRFQHHPLEVEKLRKHISEGMRATSVDLSFDGGAEFTLHDDLSIRRLRMADVEGAEDPATGGDKQEDADMALFIGNAQAILAGLAAAMATA